MSSRHWEPRGNLKQRQNKLTYTQYAMKQFKITCSHNQLLDNTRIYSTRYILCIINIKQLFFLLIHSRAIFCVFGCTHAMVVVWMSSLCVGFICIGDRFPRDFHGYIFGTVVPVTSGTVVGTVSYRTYYTYCFLAARWISHRENIFLWEHHHTRTKYVFEHPQHQKS